MFIFIIKKAYYLFIAGATKEYLLLILI